MKKILIILSALMAVMLIAACNTQVPIENEPKACTMEAMECPDGSYVGRNSNNNCAFDECPESMILCTADVKECSDGTYVGRDANNNCEFKECSEELKNPTFRNYAANSPNECAATTFLCEGKSTAFFDSTGCGCEVKEPKRYIGNSIEECSTMKFACNQGEEYFANEYGCGCEWTWNQPQEETDGKVQATDCTDPRPTACTKEYMPVCGQVQVDCIRAPCNPVKETFGNKCEACANDRTISYYEGECGTELDNPASQYCVEHGGVIDTRIGKQGAFREQFCVLPSGKECQADAYYRGECTDVINKHYCTQAEKDSEICTMDYNPVCGDDGNTYSNACGACSSGNVDAWNPGECIGSQAIS